MAGKIIVQVWFEEESRPDQRAKFELIEVECASWEKFREEVDADLQINGAQLFSRWGQARGEREITRGVPFFFRGCAVHRSALAPWSFIDAEGE